MAIGFPRLSFSGRRFFLAGDVVSNRRAPSRCCAQAAVKMRFDDQLVSRGSAHYHIFNNTLPLPPLSYAGPDSGTRRNYRSVSKPSVRMLLKLSLEPFFFLNMQVIYHALGKNLL